MNVSSDTPVLSTSDPVVKYSTVRSSSTLTWTVSFFFIHVRCVKCGKWWDGERCVATVKLLRICKEITIDAGHTSTKLREYSASITNFDLQFSRFLLLNSTKFNINSIDTTHRLERKLRADWSQGMLAVIRCRISSILVCKTTIYRSS
jgi:hypothetical protein